MTTIEHEKLIAEIPEDLQPGEKIEVSDSGEGWESATFDHYSVGTNRPVMCVYRDRIVAFTYARRPLKRLKDEPWRYDWAKWRNVNSNGDAWESDNKPYILPSMNWCVDGKVEMIGTGYDASDWQHSLEERPTDADNISDKQPKSKECCTCTFHKVKENDYPCSDCRDQNRWMPLRISPKGDERIIGIDKNGDPIIKPKEKKYRPWTIEEARGKWVCFGVNQLMITRLTDNGTHVLAYLDDEWYSMRELLKSKKQPSGQPCGEEVTE